jgi:hypothetical protein
MIENLRESLKRNLQQETPAERSQRMIPAAALGALVATAYVWTFFLVNVYTFPALPLGLDLPRLLVMWIQFALGFAVFGAIAAWFTEEYAGIVGGGLIATILIGIVFLLSTRGQSSSSTMQSVIMALPLIGICMLAAWGLRWAAHRYLAIQHGSGTDRRKGLIRHILTMTLIGLVPGVLMRMDLPSVQAIGHLHDLLQAAPGDPSVLPQLPLERVPALAEHFGVDYRIYARQSASSAGALDVTVRFSDGFRMSCLLPVGSGANFITQCNEGDDVNTTPD